MTRQHGNRFYSTSVSPKRVERIRFELFLTPMPVSVRAPLANLVVHTANALAGDEGSATRALALAELGGVAEAGNELVIIHTANALAGDEGPATRALALAELGGVAEAGHELLILGPNALACEHEFESEEPSREKKNDETKRRFLVLTFDSCTSLSRKQLYESTSHFRIHTWDEGSATRAFALAELGGVAEPGRGRLNPSDETCGAGGSSDELGNIGESLAAASRCGEGVGTADGGQCREGDE